MQKKGGKKKRKIAEDMIMRNPQQIQGNRINE